MQEQLDKHMYRILLTSVVILLAFGTVFYHYVEHFEWLDSYYFSVVTLATVGYGDYVPHTPIGKFVTTFYIMFGVGILTAFISYNARRTAHRQHERKLRKEAEKAKKVKQNQTAKK